MFRLIKLIRGKLNYWNRKIDLFEGNQNFDIVDNPSISYFESNNISNQFIPINQNNLEEYKNRFLKGHLFCGLINNDSVLVAYGWINTSETHFLGELNLKMILPNNTAVLYDFFTFETFRGHGLYSYLLKCICARDRKRKIIYALSDNKASCKGILKADFRCLGTISGFTKNNYFKMINNK